MYRLLGADQKEYGPLSADDVRRCIAERRAHRLTLARSDADIGWKPLGDFAEFKDALAAAITSAAAPTTSAPPPLGINVPRTSRLAIASLVLGVLGFCGITGLAGFILGIVALVKIHRSKGALKGTGLAIAGVAFSAVMLAALFIGAIVVAVQIANQQRQFAPGGPAFNPQPTMGRPQQWTPEPDRCTAHVRDITRGLLSSAAANDGKFPDASNWCDSVQVYLSSLGTLRCPADGSNERCSYSMNVAVAGLATNQVSPRTVIIFESRSGWNQAGNAGNVRFRHGSMMVGLADGTTTQVSPGQEGSLRWEP